MAPELNNYIEFNANNGVFQDGETFVSIARLKTDTATFSSLLKKPSREKYVFLGWSTSINGEVKYTMESSSSDIEIESITLYAVWRKVNKYIISESELTYLADIIRDVTGTTDKLSFPDGFINAINCIKKIIGFTVDDKTYQARQDMTWQEFVNSNYNVNSFVITSGKIKDANNNFIVLSSNSAYSISGDSKIIENAKYISSNIVKD